MCGIAGIVEIHSGEPRIDYPLLKRMSDVIEHRGPDSEGQWVADDRRCGLAFRRLSIIDLTDAGNQPMQTPDGRYTIVFNGEIYNHLEYARNWKNSATNIIRGRIPKRYLTVSSTGAKQL